MNSDVQVMQVSKVRGLALGLLLSIGGYFANLLAFAVAYTAYMVFFSNKDIHTPDPVKQKLKMITFAVGMIFPFIAGYYSGRKNTGNKTYTHYILAPITGLYVYYLAVGQANINYVIFFSFMGMMTVLAGFRLAYRKTSQTQNQ
jgi:hypothetical protein